jgi:transcriptional regulator with XRE-family HTH domain
MDICRRLRELRESKGLSQGDLEKKSGTLRCYISRVECGHTVPQLGTLEKWMKALGVPLYELFIPEEALPSKGPLASLTLKEKRLFELLKQIDEADRGFFLSVAEMLAKQRPSKDK